MKPSDLPSVAPSTAALPGLTRPFPVPAANAIAPRLRAAQLPLADAPRRDLAAIKKEIADDLASHNALQIVADVLALSLPRETSRDYEPAATAEYITSVLLERPSEEPIAATQGPAEKDSAVQRTLDRVRGLTLHGVEVGRRAAAEADGPLAAIAETLKTLDALNRWPGYEPQILGFTKACFDDGSTNEVLKRVLGFDAPEAFACDQAVRDLVVDGLHEWGDAVPEIVRQGLALYDSGQVPTPDALKLTDDTSPAQREHWLLAKYFFSDGLIGALSFTVEELAGRAQVDAETAAAYVDRFTASWGATGGLTLLTGRNQIRERPLLRGENGRVHPTSIGNVLWALRPALEEALKGDSDAFEQYQRRRAAHAEAETARLLVKALSPDFHLTNVDFRLPESNGEADVLLRVDDVILVVEVKSGGLSNAAYRGRESAIRRDLTALLGKSTGQAVRLQRAIDEGVPMAFSSRASGEAVEVDTEGVRRTYSIVVTLEDLHSVLMRPQRLIDSGIVEGKLPWCVSLFDLEVIVESTQFAGQFTSYLEARLALDDRVEWADEADLWMTHLLDRLDYSLVKMPRFMAADRDAPIAAQWTVGARPPRSKLPNATGKALRRLKRKRPPGWLERSEELFLRAQAGRRPRVVGPMQP